MHRSPSFVSMFLRASLLTSALVGIVSCGGGGSGSASSSSPSDAAPGITTQPRSQTVAAGNTATFSIIAAGTPTYQWQVSPDDSAWSDVTTGTGGTQATYKTAATSLTDSGKHFRVVVTNSVSHVESASVTLTVNTGSGGFATTPSFEENFSQAPDPAVWQVAGWKEESQTSPERCTAIDGKLNMVFRYDSATQAHLGAAIQTRKTFLYGRWEASLKPSSVPGILNSFYTIDWDDMTTPSPNNDGTKQEIDIEFLTYTFGPGKGKIHFAVHQAGLTSFDLNPDIELGFNPSEAFHTYGYAITPEHIQWIVDGTVLHTYTYAGNAITIDSPYQLKLNVWSQNGQNTWVKGPPVANTDCIYQIDWIKFYPYVAN